jgi:hypothetical protein
MLVFVAVVEIKTPDKHVEAAIPVILGRGFNSLRLHFLSKPTALRRGGLFQWRTRVLPMGEVDMSQTTSVLDELANPEFHDKRRTEPRVVCERSLPLTPFSGDEGQRPVSARLTDCSVHGLGMLLPQHIEAGQQVIVRMDVDRKPMMLLYTIRYCVPTQTDQFRTGARFSGYVASKFRGDMKSVVSALAESVG